MVPANLAGTKQFPALAYPNATLTCTKGSRDCIKILTPVQTKEKVEEPQKSGCVEVNLSKSTQNSVQRSSQTTKVGHVKGCLNKSGLSMAVTGIKSTLTNGMDSSAQVQAGTASFSAGPATPLSAGIHATQGTASQVTPTGTFTTNVGFGVSAGSVNEFGTKFGVRHTLS